MQLLDNGNMTKKDLKMPATSMPTELIQDGPLRS